MSILAFLFITGCVSLPLSTGNKQEEHLSISPRGVPPQLASFYQEAKVFECLDGNKQIPFDQVNDDYCDCADGSDEPGTSACKNGKFYCPNLGYQSAIIPSNRVNDYICDCCDGSDEWDSGTECPNICEAQGSKAREEAKKQRAVHEAGWANRAELAKEGAKMLEERKGELERKRKELEELEAMKEGVETRKGEVEKHEEEAKKRQDELWEAEKKAKERVESEEMMRRMDENGDGKLIPAELRKHAGLETEKGEEEEEGGGGNQAAAEILKDIFSEEVQALDLELLVSKLGLVREFLIKAKEEVDKKQEEGRAEEEDGINLDDKKGEEEKDAEVEEGDHEEKEAEEGVVPPPQQQYDEETRKLIEQADEARKEFDEIERKIGQMRDEIRDSEQFLEFEYGPDHAWAPLKGKCAELTTTQYTYKICLFDKTVQKDRGGYSEVNLGYWGTWNGPEGAKKFSSQKYEHGQGCWNGPERSTHVELECGDELELLDVSEPSKCEYKFLVKAPAACGNPEEIFKHSEL